LVTDEKLTSDDLIVDKNHIKVEGLLMEDDPSDDEKDKENEEKLMRHCDNEGYNGLPVKKLCSENSVGCIVPYIPTQLKYATKDTYQHIHDNQDYLNLWIIPKKTSKKSHAKTVAQQYVSEKRENRYIALQSCYTTIMHHKPTETRKTPTESTPIVSRQVKSQNARPDIQMTFYDWKRLPTQMPTARPDKKMSPSGRMDMHEVDVHKHQTKKMITNLLTIL
jgi:hypothetical protein